MRVLVHGLGQTKASWDRVCSYLPEDEVECVDLIALLEAKPACYQNLYDAFQLYCNKIPTPLHLCGLSLGGLLALQYSIEFPERVASLTLIGTQYRMPKTILKLQNIVFRLIPAQQFSSMGFSKQDFLTLCASLYEVDFKAQLHNVQTPTLVLCGSKDHANKKAATQISKQLPNASYFSIPQAKHEVNNSHPQQLATLLSNFWTT
ncbi:MAG: alpha/beta fold hydrolase [Erysipelotrichaceae bacterium]